MWEGERHGQEATLGQSSERNKGLDSSSIAHHVPMTVTPKRPQPTFKRQGRLEFTRK